MMNELLSIHHSAPVRETAPTVQKQPIQEVPNEEPVTSSRQEEIVDVYVPEQTSKTEESGTIYTPNGTLVDQLKREQVDVQARFLSNVRDMLTKQGKEVSGEGIWKVLAQGDYTVDPETQKEAQQAISEDGYWGVKQTSQRIVTFAKALVGGDPSRIEEMKEAFLKGFSAAEEAWGGALPEITGQTKEAVLKLFDEWEQEGTQESPSDV